MNKTEQPLTVRTHSVRQTAALGAALAAALPRPAIVALCGELGAGKTTLVQGIARGLGIAPRRVSSPTFVLIKEYRRRQTRLAHVDLYRLGRVADIALLGLDEYWQQGDIVVVEWADKAAGLLPEALTVTMTAVSASTRDIAITGAAIYAQAVAAARARFAALADDAHANSR